MAEQKHTQFAMQALGFADLFNIKIGDQKVTGHRVEMSAPDGPSTGGGKQSVQHIKLIPGDGGSVIVAGSCDQMEKAAEIRTWDYLADLHAKRFKGAKLPIDRTGYSELQKRMQAFFADQGLRVTLLDAPRPIASAGRAEAADVPAGSGKGMMVLVFVLVAAVIAAAAFFLLRGR